MLLKRKLITLLVLSVFELVICEEDVPGNLTDVSICKVSHLGVDYEGHIGKTESHVRCQSWSGKNPLHKVDPQYTDATFSDFSKARARNYCRNPNRDPTGPWCYTMAPDNIYETCGIPLCIYTECRVTGPGMEYGGNHKESVSGKKCLKWNKKRKKVKFHNAIRSQDKFHKSLFPDESLSYAKKFCRNPDSDVAGPWCFVEIEDSNVVEKEYCDIPFCDNQFCSVLTRNDEVYTHYTRFPGKLTNFSFGLKLWDPDSFMNASARLVLSLFSLPITGKDLDLSGTGIEIFIGNRRSALTYGNVEKTPDYEATPGIIKSHNFTYFSLTWWHNVITLFKEGERKPIFLAEYKHKLNLMNVKKNKFYFYGAQGTNILWSFPFCDDNDECDVHTTIGRKFQHIFPLRESHLGLDLQFHVRAFHSAYIMLLPSPVINYPNIKVLIQRADNFTRVLFTEYEGGPTAVLKELTINKLLDYWTWHEFNLGLFVNELQLYITKETGTFSVFEIKHNFVKKMRWFSVGSENSVAHWSFYCYPPEEVFAPPPWLPECTLNRKEPDYNGTQDVTSHGLPCIPWSSTKLLPEDARDLYNEKQMFEAYNYCRDPKKEQQGTYCYTISENKDDKMKKEYCHVRKCKSAECRTAGTGNDYIGKISVTRSNRTCQHWVPPAPSEEYHSEIQNFGSNIAGQSYWQRQAKTAGGIDSGLLGNILGYNNFFDETGCLDKWKCLRDAESAGRLVQKRYIIGGDNPVENNTNVTDHTADLAKLTEMTGNTNIKNQVLDSDEGQAQQHNYSVVHQVDASYLNNTLYPDLEMDKVENFCRNPSRDMAGSWCYTLDPDVPKDICNVRDCDKPEEHIIIATGHGEGRSLYILPQWKESGHHGGLRFAMKQWNPDLVNGVIFQITPLDDQASSMKLVIGADNNEKVIFYYNTKRVKEKTMPHIIPSGKWVSFWFQMRQGELLLGLEGVPNPFFEWKHEDVSDAFNPVLLNYRTSQGYPVGMFFKFDECHTENTTTKVYSKIHPIGLWSEEELPFHSNFTLKLRAIGGILIPLFLMLDTQNFYYINIEGTGGSVLFLQHEQGLSRTLKTVYTRDFHITSKNWTSLEISFAENWVNITSNGKNVLFYKSKKPMLFYWFSVGAESGWVTWTANCEPLDIDGPPLDGGWSKWSPWICTVTCGGGEGYRTRTCSNPRPNIFGQLCEGSPTLTGKCNEFECGDVSPDTIEKIREDLQKNAHSLIVKQTDSVVVRNNKKILNIVSVESPDAYYEWTLNGIFVNPEPGRVEFLGDDIVIHKAAVSDMGVYVCMLYRVNKQRLVLHVVSLAVTTAHYRIDTRATRKLILNTNAVVLGYIYTGLRQKWLLNKTVYVDYGITTLAAVSSENFGSLNKSHTGEWKCVIEQSDLRLSWVTNIIKVHVKKAPNFYTNLREDELTRPVFGWLKTDVNVFFALIFIIVFVCASVAFGLFAYLKWGRLPELNKRQKKRNRRFK